MIERLIDDNDLTISEIIEQAPVTEAAPDSGGQQPAARFIVKRSAESEERAGETSPVRAGEPGAESSSAHASAMQANNGNVWQQRAAIREMQKVQKTEQYIDKLVESKPSPDLAPPPPPVQQQQQQRAQPTETVEEVAAKVREAVRAEHVKQQQQQEQEELQKKAPGYARPVAAPSSVDQGIAVEKKTAPLSRPLSDIWENANLPSMMDPLSPPSSLLFGSAASLDPHTAALWLPGLSSKNSAIGSERKTEDTDWTKVFSSLDSALTTKVSSGEGVTATTTAASNWMTNDLFGGGKPLNGTVTGWGESTTTVSGGMQWLNNSSQPSSQAPIARPIPANEPVQTQQQQGRGPIERPINAFFPSTGFSRETTPASSYPAHSTQAQFGGGDGRVKPETVNASVMKTYLSGMQQVHPVNLPPPIFPQYLFESSIIAPV